ncbi:MAG: DUF2802 domain-containing protein [Deltaproteobacteria bacterium]|nr:DUF2802 domain-containing protein [Deltaproteobacteria bacterium]
MSMLEVLLLVVMTASTSLTIFMASKQARLRRNGMYLNDIEVRLQDLIKVVEQRQATMLKTIAKAERAIALQKAMKLGDQENQVTRFRDAERLITGGIPIGEVAERLALPRAELELLMKVRGQGNGISNDMGVRH